MAKQISKNWNNSEWMIIYSVKLKYSLLCLKIFNCFIHYNIIQINIILYNKHKFYWLFQFKNFLNFWIFICNLWPPTIILNKFLILTSSYGELVIPSISIMCLLADKLNIMFWAVKTKAQELHRNKYIHQRREDM